MADRRTERRRERHANREMEVRRAAARTQRNRKILGIAGVFAVLAALTGTLIAGARDSGDQTSTRSTTTTRSTLPGDASTTTAAPGPTVSVPAAPVGATLAGTTPCPAVDGSSPRTTHFAGPPPDCLDKTQTYDAVVSTTEGDIKLYLNTDLAPAAVNNFVVLARYHYYDGLPVTTITPRSTFEIGDVTGPDGKAGPGYDLPGDYPKGGTIITPGAPMMIPVGGQGDRIGAAFMLALGDKAANLPPTTTVFGLMLDGSDTLARIGKLGTDQGAPTKLVTITSVRIELAPVATTTTAAAVG